MQAHTYEPPAEYIALEQERLALALLATHETPAKAIATGGWRAEYFTSDEARETFARLQVADAPVTLEQLAGETVGDDRRDLAQLRAALADLAQRRALHLANLELAQALRAGLATLQRGETPDTPAAALITTYQEALARAARVLDVQAPTAGAPRTVADMIAGYWRRVAEYAETAPTGLRGLDDKLGGGFLPGRLVVLLGAPGYGKTTLANQVAEHVASAGRPVVYLTMEDTADTLLAKTIARVGALDYGAVLQGRERLRAEIAAALEQVGERPSASRLLYLESDSRLSLDALRETTRAHFARFPQAKGTAGLIVVDYLQRAARATSAASGAQLELRLAVSALTDALRDLAREQGATVLALASQNRASGYGSSSNVLSSGKESGDIEYGADVVMALADPGEGDRAKNGNGAPRPSFLKPRALYIAKNRQGEQGEVLLDWYAARQSFTMPDQGDMRETRRG